MIDISLFRQWTVSKESASILKDLTGNMNLISRMKSMKIRYYKTVFINVHNVSYKTQIVGSYFCIKHTSNGIIFAAIMTEVSPS
jgi:hypothetical protein